MSRHCSSDHFHLWPYRAEASLDWSLFQAYPLRNVFPSSAPFWSCFSWFFLLDFFPFDAKYTAFDFPISPEFFCLLIFVNFKSRQSLEKSIFRRPVLTFNPLTPDAAVVSWRSERGIFDCIKSLFFSSYIIYLFKTGQKMHGHMDWCGRRKTINCRTEKIKTTEMVLNNIFLSNWNDLFCFIEIFNQTLSVFWFHLRMGNWKRKMVFYWRRFSQSTTGRNVAKWFFVFAVPGKGRRVARILVAVVGEVDLSRFATQEGDQWKRSRDEQHCIAHHFGLQNACMLWPVVLEADLSPRPKIYFEINCQFERLLVLLWFQK